MGDSTGCRDLQQQALALLGQLSADFAGTARFCDSLAWLLTSGPAADLEDLPRAAELAKRATALVPDNKFYWRTLGTVQYRRQEWESARGSLRQADALRPVESGISTCVQAMIEWQLGNHDAARSLLDAATTWSDLNRPGDDELTRFRDEAKGLLAGPSPREDSP
jgi:tetratricopeptide (TPR) repeat protein